MKKIILYLFLALLLLAGCGGQAAKDETASAQVYIENKGSDTIVNLALAWAERYQELNNHVSISVTGGGSGTGLAALSNGTVDIANASRAIKTEEIELAREQGIEPVEFIIARDAIAIIVNPENPVERLTLPQLSQIYMGEINNWKELGGDDRPIVRLSRETNSGTHVYFLESVIRLGEDNDDIFSADTLLLPSSEGIISEVKDNPNAIGYDGLGYVTSDVKVLAVAKTAGEEYTMPSVETVNDNSYPISRDLYMYTKNEPEGVIKEYLEWVYQEEAQDIVKELGFVPVAVH